MFNVFFINSRFNFKGISIKFNNTSAFDLSISYLLYLLLYLKLLIYLSGEIYSLQIQMLYYKSNQYYSNIASPDIHPLKKKIMSNSEKQYLCSQNTQLAIKNNHYDNSVV